MRVRPEYAALVQVSKVGVAVGALFAPLLSPQDASGLTVPNAKTTRQRMTVYALLGMKAAHLLNLLSRQLGSPVLLARMVAGQSLIRAILEVVARGLPSAPGPHILHVIPLCSQTEVCRIGTLGIVANMPDNHTERNRPILKFPRDAVSEVLFIRRSVDNPIAEKIVRTIPAPATITLNDVPGVPISKARGFLDSVGALFTAILFTATDTGWGARDDSTAETTHKDIRGILRMHAEPPIQCAKPRVVAATPGFFAAQL